MNEKKISPIASVKPASPGLEVPQGYFKVKCPHCEGEFIKEQPKANYPSISFRCKHCSKGIRMSSGSK